MTEVLKRKASSGRGVSEPPSRPLLARAIILGVRLVGAMPLRVLHILGGAVGWLGWLLPTRERHVSRVNLSLAFPEMDPRDRERLVRTSLIETGKQFAEICAFWTADRPRLERMIVASYGLDELQAAVSSGTGVIIAAPHLGAWELGGSFLSWTFSIHGLYRTPRIRELESFFLAARSRFGSGFSAAGPGAARALLRTLKNGGMIGILPDQDSGEGAGVFVPFFGVPANTMTLLSRLASRSGARVFLAWSERLPRSRGFHHHYIEVSPDVYSDDPAVSAAALNRDIEAQVRRRPEQYLWSYKRYRIRPPGSPNPYRKRKR